MNSQLGGPISEALRTTVKEKNNVVPPVPGLGSPQSPSAVVWRVWAIIVDAVDAVFGGRSRTHIGKERLERLPSVAYDDSATAVKGEVCGVRVLATPLHCGPCAIFWSVDQSMLERIGKASAATGMTPFDFVSTGDELGAARTSTNVVILALGALVGYSEHRYAVENGAR